jgi:hypothetical protein
MAMKGDKLDRMPSVRAEQLKKGGALSTTELRRCLYDSQLIITAIVSIITFF